MITDIINMIEVELLTEANKETENKPSAKGKNVQKIQLSKESIRRFQNTQEGGYLSHFRCDKNVRGFMLVSSGKLIGAVAVEKSNDGHFWIQALEVTKGYENQGYGKQLLSMAKSLGATHLSVRKRNREALHLYLNAGFKAYRDTGYQYLMSTQNMGTVINVKDPFEGKKPKKQEKTKTIKEAVEKDLAWKFTESVSMDGNDCVINLDNFEKGLFNFVLVIGLPGSGKGTFGRQLSKKYNAVHLELDIFDQCGNMSDEEIRSAGSPFKEYILDKQEGQWYRKNANTLSVNEKLQGNHDFIEYVIAYCKANRDKIFVIDGTPIYAAMEPDEICNYPIIIKGTSAQSSFLNKVNRDMGTKSSDKKLHSKVTREDLKGLLSYYWGDDKYLVRFKKELIDNPDTTAEGPHIKETNRESDDSEESVCSDGETICEDHGGDNVQA